MPMLLAALHTATPQSADATSESVLPALVFTGDHSRSARDLFEYLTGRGWSYLHTPLALSPLLNPETAKPLRILSTNCRLTIHPCQPPPAPDPDAFPDGLVTESDWWHQITRPGAVSAVVLADTVDPHRPDVAAQVSRAARHDQLLWRTAHLIPTRRRTTTRWEYAGGRAADSRQPGQGHDSTSPPVTAGASDSATGRTAPIGMLQAESRPLPEAVAAVLRRAQEAEQVATGSDRRIAFRLTRNLLGGARAVGYPIEALADCLECSVATVRTRAGHPGQLSAAAMSAIADLPPDAVHRWRADGLLPAPGRDDAGQDCYPATDFIRALARAPRTLMNPQRADDTSTPRSELAPSSFIAGSGVRAWP